MPQETSLSKYNFPGLQEKISLDFQDMEITDALKFLAVKGNLNIVASTNITGTINLLLTDVTIGDVLEVILVVNNLAYEVKGNIIKVITTEDYEKLYGRAFYDQRKVEIVRLKYAPAANVGAVLEGIKSNIGSVIYDEGAGTVVLVDTPEKIAQMKEVIETSEMPTVSRTYPTVTETFNLQYAKVEEVSEKITPVLTPEIGETYMDVRTNNIVITDLPHKLEKIRELIKTFDEKTKEVFIEAKVVQVSLDDHFQWGVDWDQIAILNDNIRFAPEVTLPESLGSGGSLTVTSTGADVNLVLEALDALQDIQIISNPHLAVIDGEEAKLVVASKQPYAVTTSSLSDGTTTTATDITFVDIGVTLIVVPKINKDGFVTMDVKSEISESTSNYTYGDPATTVPIVETRDAETTVMVKDGTTIIIAGLIKNEKRYTENKVPFFGDIPFLGPALFTNIDDEIIKSETVIFLTPRIITGEEPFELLRDIEEERAAEKDQVLGEELDISLEEYDDYYEDYAEFDEDAFLLEQGYGVDWDLESEDKFGYEFFSEEDFGDDLSAVEKVSGVQEQKSKLAEELEGIDLEYQQEIERLKREKAQRQELKQQVRDEIALSIEELKAENERLRNVLESRGFIERDSVDEVSELKAEKEKLAYEVSKAKDIIERSEQVAAAAHTEKEKFKKLIYEYKKLVEENRKLLAGEAIKRKSLESTLEDMKQGLKKERLDMYYNLGVIFDKHNLFEETEKAYLKALEIDPNDSQAHYNLGVIYDEELNMPDLALKHYQSYLRLRPDAENADKVREWIKEVREEEK
jgi:type II secretory pathway component GspD/PulD (secretin)